MLRTGADILKGASRLNGRRIDPGGARTIFFVGEKFFLRWLGTRRFVKAIREYMYQIEDLRGGSAAELHTLQHKLYNDGLLDKGAVMAHVLSSEIGMLAQRLIF